MPDRLIPLGELLNAWALGIVDRPQPLRWTTDDSLRAVEELHVQRLHAARAELRELVEAGVDNEQDHERIRTRERILARIRSTR
jgi:hypothetical protein